VLASQSSSPARIVKYADSLSKATWPERYKIANPLNEDGEWWTYRGESFEMYSNPIPLKYAQVAYQFHTGLLLPEHIRKRYSLASLVIRPPCSRSEFIVTILGWCCLTRPTLSPLMLDRFHGRDIAFTGYEVNVVRFDENGNEETVPSYDAYNHHYVIYMKGANWTVQPT
jgi:hypothetical protein